MDGAVPPALAVSSGYAIPVLPDACPLDLEAAVAAWAADVAELEDCLALQLFLSTPLQAAYDNLASLYLAMTSFGEGIMGIQSGPC